MEKDNIKKFSANNIKMISYQQIEWLDKKQFTFFSPEQVSFFGVNEKAKFLARQNESEQILSFNGISNSLLEVQNINSDIAANLVNKNFI